MSEAGKKVAGGPKFRFEYYSPRPPYWSYDGLPFGSVYGAFLVLVAALVARRGTLAFEHMLWCLVPPVLHVLLFLATQWSVEARCAVRFRCEPSIERATHAKVVRIAAKSHKTHKILLVPISRQDSEVSLHYLKKKFIFSEETGQFERLRCNITSPLGTYLSSTGLTAQQANNALKRFGANTYDIPLPTFGELFQEHAVAPFFVFQVFCVLLWLMDEYWYYSLLTLFMLIVLEAQMVHRRRSDLSELRAMRIPPRPMHVLRAGSWGTVQSDQLLPGDVVALVRKADVSFPCDVLLLQGNVLVNEAMLTGESVPQMKVAVAVAPGSPELEAPLDVRGMHKQHVVSAGTNIMMHQNTSKDKAYKKVPAVGSSTAAVGYVLRTGFDTTQGKLCRTILFSAERVTVQSREALYFLMILLAFAVGACCYVLYDGLVLAPLRVDEPARSSFKLFLSVSHIITSVVPPEFPIMLSLAVNLSLVALVQKRIFCTEPFRVPLAGRVETCCFDKTGTLTSDSMEVAGVHGLADGTSPPPALPAGEAEQDSAEGSNGSMDQPLPFLTTALMASCNGLTVVEGEVVGDPLEKAALGAVRWLMLGPDIIVSKIGKGADKLQVLRRFPFASELQRMAVLIRHQGPALGHMQVPPGARIDHDRVLALVKGSCEALRPRLKEVPAEFDSLQERLSKSGLRVLCLAAKEMPAELAKQDLEKIDREELESGLAFQGLLALRNAVKPHTSSTVKQLRRSYHRVVMITGDHPLTACQVASQVSMAEGQFLILEPAQAASIGSQPASAPALEWRSREDGNEKAKPFSLEKLRDLTRHHTLCVPGWSLSQLTEEQLQMLAPSVTVFARVSPQQKEQVVDALNQRSHTMMVGDGTNDVGALKHAHVGVSLLTTVMPTPGSPPSGGMHGQPGAQHDALGADGGPPLVRLGDASIASPFTYKGDSVKCSLNILRCGRATLSTVLMMYKIMGLNSVMSAFAMSVLTLDGVKLGDGQTAMESLFTSACFFLVSRSAPAKQLAKQQPTCSVFAWPVLLALALQLVVHMSVLLAGWQLARSYRSQDFKRDIEGEFEPNLTNTMVFQLMAAMHASSFLANYEGHPFMQPLTANKALVYSLGGFIVIIFMTALEVLPDLNSGLSLVASPDDAFRQRALVLVVLDIGLSVVLSRAVGMLAVRLRGRAAEKRARELGLGLAPEKADTGESGGGKKKEKVPKVSPKAK
mmetsp:Transcript_126796/g.370660  ORF Transcript_126796/g.370660 Transcript_126796/m.370660 type:complete len:1214 (-) Transcript_126796:94-3735(-)